MLPKSLSATALHVAELCLSRYAAEQFYRARGMGSNFAADVGTACHGGLEGYVKITQIEKSQPESLDLLNMFYRKSFMDTFDTLEPDGMDGYDTGLELMEKWYKRTSFEGVEVISCEVKSNFPVSTSQGVIPFNYIWDRFDKIGPKVFKVEDYKSSAWNIRPEDLRKKIQARAYALAAAIQLKRDGIDYDKIWVEFDMLKFDPVGVVFTRDEITETWHFIKNLVEEKILATPVDKAPEKLNSECRFCVKKNTCKALSRNIAGGGVMGLDIPQIIDRRYALQNQLAGINAALNELDEVILTTAKGQEVFELESDMNKARIGLTNTQRKVNADQVEMIVGNDIFEEYGAKSMAVGQWEKLCKDKRLTDEQKKLLKPTVYKPPGSEKIYVESKSPFDMD